MSNPLPVEKTAFVTFYSFKGGVGRSMALINVAGIMAGRGFRVLAMDMDLEAPGISYLMRHEAKLEGQHLPGFVDLLSDACERGEAGDLFTMEPQELVERYTYVYPIPDPIRQSDDGLLRIMPAGQFGHQDQDYQQRLDRLGLGQLYRDGQGQPLIAAVKHILTSAKMFDIVFIDSRTGFSDESGICTRDLGDHLVVVMGLNRQNQEGTAAFLRSLRASGNGSKPLRVVLSPVPNGEDDLLDSREAEAREVLSEAFGRNLDLNLQIPYHPRLALTEEPHIFRRSRGPLFEAYSEIEKAVLTLLGITQHALRDGMTEAVKKRQPESVLHQLRQLHRIDPSLTILSLDAYGDLFDFYLTDEAQQVREFLASKLPDHSWTAERLAFELHKKNRPDAEAFYLKLINADPQNASKLSNFASFLTEIRKDHDQAEEIYRRALEAEPKNANNLGNFATFLKTIRKDHDRAESLYRRALEVDPVNPHNLGNFASFLTNIRKDYEAAKSLYRRALNVDPVHPNNLGNFAQALFITGNNVEASQRMAEAWAQEPDNEDLQCELPFYAFCHLWESHPNALPALKKLLVAGKRSKDWPLGETVRVGIAAGHPHPEFLKALAAVVSAEADIETLHPFRPWKEA